MNGTWKTGFYYGNIKDSFTDIAPFGPRVTANTRAAIWAKRVALISGKFYEFTGAALRPEGKLRVPAGRS